MASPEQSSLGSLLLLAGLVFIARKSDAQLTPGFRPPSVPLMVVNPYFSVWSNADCLYDDVTRHWSGASTRFTGMILIDNKPYRFMSSGKGLPDDVIQQKSVQVYPTRTVYSFEGAGVQLTVTFTTPSFPSSDDQRSLLYGMLPVTYLTYEVGSTDGTAHDVKLYYDNTAEIAVADVLEEIAWARQPIKEDGMVTMRLGTVQQKFAGQGSDRINWGYFYVSVPQDSTLNTSLCNVDDAKSAFMSGKPLPSDNSKSQGRCSVDWPGIAVTWDLGKVGTEKVSKYALAAYDQVLSIRYFGTDMMPAWRHAATPTAMLELAHDHMDNIIMNCVQMDADVMGQLSKIGGSNYTSIASLVWRQAIGGTERVWNSVADTMWFFMKEISSDGDVSTVDVVFPASPLFIWQSPKSYFLLVEPILVYANNGTGKYGTYIPYNLAWCPHHLGHWPVCDLPPNRQEQMPIEETGNILIILAAIAKSDPSWLLYSIKPYTQLLKIFGDYLVSSLPDPKDQLCTDDFEGPSPHNVNLAAKGIVGLGAYSYLLRLNNQTQQADYYLKAAQGFVQYWLNHSLDGDHYKLQYDKPGSWSLKYNLMYQKFLGLDLFPDSVFAAESKYYQEKSNRYGVPLDDRADFTKSDWMMWVAAMGDSAQFKSLVDKLYLFATTTPDRVPFTDWYYTSTAKLKGFRARPVMGGLYARALFGLTL